jgi:hypothetical protein
MVRWGSDVAGQARNLLLRLRSAGQSRAHRVLKTHEERSDQSGGFAAVDALVALSILATTIILALSAAQTARQTAVAASEMRRAEDLLRYLVDTAPWTMGRTSGHTTAFAWRIDTEPTGTVAPTSSVQICSRSAQLRGVLTGRSYRIDTAAICLPRGRT